MLPERREVERGVDRDAVAEEVQRGVGDVDHARPVRRLHPGLSDVPLAWERPVEDLGPGRKLDGLERNVLADPCERRAHAVPGEAPRDRKELCHQGVELAADGVGLRNGGPVDRHRGIRGPARRLQP